MYEINEAENVPRGTKIVIHLKPECREFADDTRIRNVIKKYSNFVNCPIFVNNERCNLIQVRFRKIDIVSQYWGEDKA